MRKDGHKIHKRLGELGIKREEPGEKVGDVVFWFDSCDTGIGYENCGVGLHT